MYFSYLSLPRLPEEFFEQCLENVKLIGVEPKLDRINNYRGPMNRATILPKEVNIWIAKNIVIPLYDHVPPELKLNLLNVTTYQQLWEKEETWGTHPKHIDNGRHWALNYYFTTGGKNTTIRWYENNNVVAETLPIESNRWCLLKVDELHDVRGIEKDQIRYFITLDILSKNIDRIRSTVDQNTIIGKI